LQSICNDLDSDCALINHVADLFDVNNDCVFDLVDVMSLLTYIYLGGAHPTYGCIESN
jgi:hypothetical protein